jgi:hypothetical protein
MMSDRHQVIDRGQPIVDDPTRTDLIDHSITGADDKVGPPEASQELAQAHGEATVEILPGVRRAVKGVTDRHVDSVRVPGQRQHRRAPVSNSVVAGRGRRPPRDRPTPTVGGQGTGAVGPGSGPVEAWARAGIAITSAEQPPSRRSRPDYRANVL